MQKIGIVEKMTMKFPMDKEKITGCAYINPQSRMNVGRNNFFLGQGIVPRVDDMGKISFSDTTAKRSSKDLGAGEAVVGGSCSIVDGNNSTVTHVDVAGMWQGMRQKSEGGNSIGPEMGLIEKIEIYVADDISIVNKEIVILQPRLNIPQEACRTKQTRFGKQFETMITFGKMHKLFHQVVGVYTNVNKVTKLVESNVENRHTHTREQGLRQNGGQGVETRTASRSKNESLRRQHDS